jgi:hypothetical protein
MAYKVGRLLQLAAMIILPVAIAGQMLERFGTKDELVLLCIGVVVFYVGWRLQQTGKA